MANLTESAVYEAGIYQLETTDPVIGGPSGISNLQAKQLANRTKYIYDILAAGGVGAEALEFSGDLNTLKAPGFVLVRSTATNKPISGLGHLIVTGRQSVPELANVPGAVQMFLSQQVNQIFFRFLAGTTWTAWFGLQTTTAADTASQMFTGMIGYFPTAAAPNGWLPANGAQVSRTTYAALFARIGTTSGTGNGTTTFTLPDLRGLFVRGLDDGRGIDPARTLATYQPHVTALKAHTHNYDKAVVSATRYVNDLGVGNGSPVTLVNSFTPTASSSSAEVPGNPDNVALLACIKY